MTEQQTITAGLETARTYSRRLTVNDYKTFERITANEYAANAFINRTIKNGMYELLAVDSVGYYGVIVAIIATESNRVIYTDSELHYNYYPTTSERVEKMLKKAVDSVFTFDEIAAPVKNYDDYRIKFNFLLNIAPRIYKRVSMVYIGEPSAKQLAACNWYYSRYTFNRFERREDAQRIDSAFAALDAQHDHRLQSDINYFQTAVKYELYNHEYGYTGDPSDTLQSLNLTVEKIRGLGTDFYTAYCNCLHQVREACE